MMWHPEQIAWRRCSGTERKIHTFIYV